MWSSPVSAAASFISRDNSAAGIRASASRSRPLSNDAARQNASGSNPLSATYFRIGNTIDTAV